MADLIGKVVTDEQGEGRFVVRVDRPASHALIEIRTTPFLFVDVVLTKKECQELSALLAAAAKELPPWGLG